MHKSPVGLLKKANVYPHYVHFEGTVAQNKNEISAIHPSINICISDRSLGL